MKNSRWILVMFLLLYFSGCKKWSSSDSSCSSPGLSLYKLADFKVGAAVNVSLLQNNQAYRDVVIRHFNLIKPENSYLLYKMQPQQGQFDFSEFDYLVNFCKTYNKHLEGANLMYQLYLPGWLENYEGIRPQWEEIAKNHIQTVVKRYKGVVESWVVVNEALNEDGTLQKNIWLEHLGPQYIEFFFQWAHEADPGATLFYNDFSLESNHVKLKAALDLIDVLHNHGQRVDGIGMQMHISDVFPAVEEISKAALLIASKNLEVYYSEWDISLNITNNKTALTQKMMERQKDLVENIVRGYKELPKKYRHGISFWNVGDGDSWIRSYFHRIDWPLLFDENYKEKPAFCGFVAGLKK